MKETLSVLVVDDELGMRLAVERALRNYKITIKELDIDINYTIIQTGTGEDALALIKSEPPQILLLDHKLPGMTGIDVLKEISAENEDMLTIMITAYASLDTAILATKLGAFDFVAKPFTPDELKAALCKASRHYVNQRQARKLAEEKRQIRFQFLSVLAHELKAPLAAIEGYLFVLRDRLAGDDPAAYDKIVARSLIRTKGMRKLIFDLLDLTRIESGQKKRELAEMDLTESLQTCVENILPAANERKITVKFDIERPLLLTADKGEIEIILNNLLSNGVKYNREEGHIEVNIEERDTKYVLTVADTGIGMSQDECDRLFEEFVRIRNKKTRDIPGSGLGLSIVRRLARLYGGDATVKSEPDVGTTFSVTLEKNLLPE